MYRASNAMFNFGMIVITDGESMISQCERVNRTKSG